MFEPDLTNLILNILYELFDCFDSIHGLRTPNAWTYLQLPLRQWVAGNVYLLVLSSWNVNIAENPIAVMGL